MRLLSRLVLLASLIVAGLVARPAPARAQVRPRPGALPGTPQPRPDSVRADSIRSDAARRDTTRRDSTGGAQIDSAHAAALRAATDTTWDPLRDLNVQFDGRMESKIDRVTDKRCASGQSFALALACRPGFPSPDLNLQFNVKADGDVVDRLHLSVDYDSQREFDASNVLRLSYEGKPQARLGRVEVGNVSFAPPPSRFITGGIPSNNYGLNALGQLGMVRWRAIAAQQRGNVVAERVFTVGGGGGAAVATQDRAIEDFEVEPRRFFLTVDPRTLPGWPNVDILDRARLARIAASLPDTLRPTRLVVYRQYIGSQAQNPRGPRLSVRGANNPRRQTYEVLRENVDYYLDPSQLWIALVRPLQLNSERLAVAYEVTVNGQRTRWPSTGGTPDLEFAADSQVANLLWEPELTPNDAAFYRELRNVYRVGGEDVRRETVALRVVTGSAGDQEAPVDPTAGSTYLQLFGLAQRTSPTTFDVENRLWPRPQDPNASASQPGTKLIRDHFVVFPSAQPFARAGLVRSLANPANDTIYTYPNEFLYSTQRPQRVYRMRVRYESEGTGAASTLMLGAVQLRPGSERLVANGRQLVRDVDYTVDYELGLVTFLRAESLFPTTSDVSVRYEENPIFVSQPTTVFGAAAELPTRAGSLFLTALSQNQSSQFTRPQLGFESSGSFVAGVGADLAWNAPLLSRLAGRLTSLSRAARGEGGDPLPPSRVTVRGELAASKPRATNGMQAYVESFEGDGGIQVPLTEASWYYSSLPRVGAALGALGLGPTLVERRAATLAWQGSVTSVGSRIARRFPIDSIDPAIRLSSGGQAPTEPVLWLSLFPLSVGGQPAADTLLGTSPWRWTIANAPAGRRWRSLRTLLNAGGTGIDVTRAEMLEFYALVRTDAQRGRNPTLVLDFGSPSENTVAIVPETLSVARTATVDSTYRGWRLAAYDRVDTERDTLTRAFNASVNDVGLPGDVVPAITVLDGGLPRGEAGLPLCRATIGLVRPLGDPRADCTRQNSRLDEEDIDQDGTLSIDATNEAVRRYVVNLADPRVVTRETGACVEFPSGIGDGLGAGATVGRRCWVQVRIPFRAPVDSTPGFNERRVRALRMTVISAREEPDDAFTRLAIARLRITGAPWLKRSGRALTGAAGDSTGAVGSYVIASTIGTQDSSYTPPPGVTEQTDQRRTGFETQQEQINERSLRLQAGAPGGTLAPFERAEAFFRFPEGVKNVMTYRQLRLWLRGVRSGWGPGGELNAYVKLGRDEDNFYMYRTEVNAGGSAESWLPEVRVDFERFYRLRAALQDAYLRGGPPGGGQYECRGADAELVRRSGLPHGQVARRWAACDGGYMIYTVDPNVSPPNLQQVQEVAVGLVRVDSAARGGNAILPGDTLELWVDDVRLADAEDAPGMAGEISVSAQLGDLAELRVGLTRRDPHFRQLAEAPTFATSNDVTIGATVRLDRLLPYRLGIAMPLTVLHTGAASTPLFVAGSDLRGSTAGSLRTPRDATTSYALTLRRASPAGGPLGVLLDNLSLTSTYVTGQARSTYQGSARHAFSLRADYDLMQATQSLVAPGTPTIPGPPGGSAFGAAPGAEGVRWSPTTLRLTSQLARSGNRQESFLKPITALDDTGQVVRGAENVWRHSAVVEFHPVSALTARWDASTLRDLREYRDVPLGGFAGADSLAGDRADAVRQDRGRVGPLDFGFERERAMNGTLELTPTLPRVSGWLKPRAQATNSYTMTRDPNARPLLGPGDLFADTLVAIDTGVAALLPRRLGSTQLLSAGVNVDVGRALLLRAGATTGAGADTTTHRGLRRFAAILQPLDVTVSRTLTSAFDATAADPSLALQLGLGGIDAFRAVDGRSATAAGLVNRVTVINTFVLPFGLSLTNRLEGGATRTWWRRALTNEQAEGTGMQRTLPDLTLRWSWRPAWAAPVFSDLSATAGFLKQRQTSRSPEDLPGLADERTTDAERFPFSARVTWPWLGGLTTLGGASLVRRTDDLPGARSTSATRERNAELRRAFHPPSRWGLKSDITTSAGFQLSRRRDFLTPRDSLGALTFQAGSGRITQADVGRQAFTLNAHSDVAQGLTLSLNGARVVTFNNNINQRLVQTVFSAALQLTFFPGQFR